MAMGRFMYVVSMGDRNVAKELGSGAFVLNPHQREISDVTHNWSLGNFLQAELLRAPINPYGIRGIAFAGRSW